MARHSFLKPKFINQLCKVDAKELPAIIKAVDEVVKDPAPSPPNRIKLRQYKRDVYRARCGNYRVLYAFDKDAVSFLGVDTRSDKTYKDIWTDASRPEIPSGLIGLGDDFPEPVEQDLLSAPSPISEAPEKSLAPAATEQAPEERIEISSELLFRLAVPEEFRAPLLACKTLADLVEVEVPEDILNRVFDAVGEIETEEDLAQVIAQPDLIAPEAIELERAASGELVPFLMRLTPEQERYVREAASAAGPVVVKGGPGSGKSTVALYSVPETIAKLRRSGVDKPKILITTYTNALIHYAELVCERLVPPEDRDCVEISTVDKVLLDIAKRFGASMHRVDDATVIWTLRHDVLGEKASDHQIDLSAEHGHILRRFGPDYLVEEIGLVIEGRGLRKLSDYIEASRVGRRVPLNRNEREAVWHAHLALQSITSRRKQQSWHTFRRRTAEIIESGVVGSPFDAVVVDEAQDLDPVALKAIASLCTSPDRLFVTLDANQSIHGAGLRSNVLATALGFTGRMRSLRRNFRTTAEIASAASAYLRHDPDAELDSDVHTQAELPGLSGPRPATRRVADREAEFEAIAEYLRTAAREQRAGLSSCAVFVPDHRVGLAIATELSARVSRAVFRNSSSLDLREPAIKVLPIRACKGLEFPVVAIAGFHDYSGPHLSQPESHEELREAVERERRKLYVAMTRAMRSLLVLLPANPSDALAPLVEGFDPAFWDMDEERAVVASAPVPNLTP